MKTLMVIRKLILIYPSIECLECFENHNKSVTTYHIDPNEKSNDGKSTNKCQIFHINC